MKLEEFGVGKITKQNTTVDVKPGETERQAKKLGLVNGKPKLLHKTAAKNSDPNTLFNLGLAEGYGKDVDEKFVTDTIKHFAKKYGINEKIALAVWQSEGGMNWQSKLKPKSKKVKTDGGQEASYGPFQLYTGKGGLGSAWEKLTGKKLSSSTSKKDIASQIDFALKTVPKRGWQDFKGANRVGINQYDGVPTKNNPMYNKMPIPKPADVKNKSMYNKVDNIKTQPSILDPRPLVKTISKGAQDAYNKTAKELGNIEVDKDSFTYKNVVKPASKAYDYISKGFTGFMKDIKKSPEYKAAGERNKKLYGPKNTVKEITVTELVVPVNDTQHAIERLKVAAELCSKMGNQPILYRAMHTGTYQGGAKQNLIQKVDNPPRKGVMGNFNPIQKAVLEDLNIVSPAQATTVAPGSTSSYFGTNHIMIPGGDFTAYWNPDIDDLGGFDGYDPKYAQGAGEGGGTVSRRDKPPSEEMQKILSGYQKGIPSYSQHKGEVILDTPFYYILNLQSFLSTFGGKKVKELITVQNKSTFSPISAELLASKFKTYSDIGWYLANPATNMLKWIASKEKIKSQESVKELKINKPDTKDTLGKLRKDMPQVKKQDYEEFMDYLKSNGAKFRKETVPASELKAMQSEFSDAGVVKQLQKNIDQGINSKAIIISDDDYVLDGHHRWLVAMNTGNDLDVYRINISAHKLFDLTKGFEKTYYKGMYETPGTINVPMASGLTISLFPHRPLKIKKPTKGKLNYNEAFNNPYPIDWDGSDDPESDRWIGNSILADGSLLTLEIMEVDPGEFQIDFYRKDKSNVDTMKATGQGDEFRVFATVQKGILEWWESIDQDEVSRIEFSASKESDDSKNRHVLYARFAKQWAAKIGWVATTGQVDDAIHFVIMRPNAAKFAKDQDLEVMEDLRKWFKQKWVNIGKKKKGGGYADCGTSGDKKGYAKCVPAKKAASMTKKEKESAVRRKRAAQNKKGRGGKKKAGSGKKPISVKTKKESVNEDKVYDILLDNIGAGPFDGGCVVVAQALQKIHGGELMALVRNDGIADHAVVQVGETMYDYDGPGTVKEVVERFEKNEGARIDSVRKLRMTDLPDAPRSNELAKQIASEMKPVKEEKIEEGVNDPHIFKAVFMAGGPGSGKSFVAKNLLGGTGLRPVNSDEVYEFLLKRQGLTLGPDDIASDKGQEIRGTAKDLTDKRQNNYIDGRLGLIIDGTGKVPELIQKLATQLKSIGYSVSMIFVNTSLEVAQQRNLERERTLPKDIVANSWDEVQQNLMKYQQIFGADRFHIIDNSGGLEDLDRTKNFDKVYNEVQRFINTPPKHQKALEWIQNQKAQNNARQTTDSGKSDGGVTSTN